MARPSVGTGEYKYLKSFLGTSVTPDQVNFLANQIEQSILTADVVGLRSDLLGPNISDDLLNAPDAMIVQRLVDTYPIRDFERTRLGPDAARRLAQTRKAMESFKFSADALLSDAWIHVALAEIGFLSALMREAPSIAVVTSTDRRALVQRLTATLSGRLRYFECPSYPWVEHQWGGDHAFLWDRWTALVASVEPSYPGEPMFISAGIWTKSIAPAWAARGGIALDIGSVMDYLDNAPTRPAVLATRYGDAQTVPHHLSLDAQFENSKPFDDFLD